jgi:hydrogenase expression/formation protein HypE
VTASDDDSLGACPIPSDDYARIVLAHGGGGRLSGNLLRQVFLPAFSSNILAQLEDSALVQVGQERLAFTTDGFVVRPLFFPGGDVGRLAVAGTVNDLAVMGARPLYLAAAFILEEGFPLGDLERIVVSMKWAAEEAGVELVTGDTKVVERGSGDGVFIVTTGIGSVPAARQLSVSGAKPGDRVLISGTIGDHGIAVLSAREGLELETRLESDCAPLGGLIDALLSAVPETRCLRDPTRGGLGSTLIEIVQASGVSIEIDEVALPVRPEVHAACELLGFDALFVANEGKVAAIVPESEVAVALATLRAHPLGQNAACIGRVSAEPARVVTLRSSIGGRRVLTQPSGEQLPRIC